MNIIIIVIEGMINEIGGGIIREIGGKKKKRVGVKEGEEREKERARG